LHYMLLLWQLLESILDLLFLASLWSWKPLFVWFKRKWNKSIKGIWNSSFLLVDMQQKTVSKGHLLYRWLSPTVHLAGRSKQVQVAQSGSRPCLNPISRFCSVQI
jgi:hypothetical protein